MYMSHCRFQEQLGTKGARQGGGGGLCPNSNTTMTLVVEFYFSSNQLAMGKEGDGRPVKPVHQRWNWVCCLRCVLLHTYVPEIRTR
jgi:hypothetical protein